MLAGSVRIAAHRVKRQRPDGIGSGRSDIHFLAVSVGIQQERSRPAARNRRQRPRRKTQRHLVARRGDREHVIGAADERKHVAVPRIAAGRRLPRRDRRDATVVVAERLPSIRRHFRREPARPQLRRRRRDPRYAQRYPSA